MTHEDDRDLTEVSPLRIERPEGTTPPSPPITDASATSSGHDDDATVFQPVVPTRASSVPVSATQHAHAGLLLKERFLLLRELGRGGMGVVYLARDERKVEAQDRDPEMAVKVLNDAFRRHPDALVALQREARRTQHLAHPNIVRVHDFDRHGDIVFMTMEYIDGRDLRRVIREDATGGMPLARAWPLIQGMGCGLQHAHDNGVVHADFKPGNVMVTGGGTAKVFDFGIARAGAFGHDGHPPRDDDDATVFDAHSLNALTPAYASPDVTSGKRSVPADDIYALGCVVFELLTGAHPFERMSAEDAMRNGRRAPRVRGLRPRAWHALRDSVAFERHRRPRSVAALLDELRPRSMRERLRGWMAIAAVVVAIAAIGGWAILRGTHAARMSTVAAAFTEGGDEGHALKAFERLDDDERARFVLDGNRRIEAFLAARLDHYWHPATGAEDYAGVQRVFALRDRLKLFSPSLDARKAAVERERNDRLNAFDSRLRDALAAGSLLDGPADSTPVLVRRIRALDPEGARQEDDEIGLKYEAAIAAATARGDTDQARRLLTVASTLFPDSQRLRARRNATQPAASPSQAEATMAEMASAIEAVKRAAAAGDTDKAQRALDHARALQADNGFVKDDGPRLIAATYLDQAHDKARHGHWPEAVATLRGAMTALGRRTDLQAARERYDLVATVEAALDATPPVATNAVTDIQKRYDALRRTDARGLRQLDGELHDAGRAGALSMATLLASLAAHTSPAAVADVVGQRPREASTHGLARAQGGDPCNLAALAGSGRSCIDLLSDGTRAPATVVVPGGDGLAPYAITRTPITVADFNRYCAGTERCEPLTGDPAQPARRLYLAQARMYASWLSRMSGYGYRLPSDAEWKHAIVGNATCKDSGRGARRDGGTWGTTLDGRTDEWVVATPHTVVVSATAPCTASPRHDDRGPPQADVGFRLVRTLR
ncbi:protein kinase [Xanthomonas sp. NCPPB 2632]|uniref:bifunctional serine/threonine-protein kinase/formylglycine-generating enzyme family protein n=1 Tax=Xanthomonas sp. NCPPB 2632 TaxID=3240912 RepID=UPI0035196325